MVTNNGWLKVTRQHQSYSKLSELQESKRNKVYQRRLNITRRSPPTGTLRQPVYFRALLLMRSAIKQAEGNSCSALLHVPLHQCLRQRQLARDNCRGCCHGYIGCKGLEKVKLAAMCFSKSDLG